MRDERADRRTALRVLARWWSQMAALCVLPSLGFAGSPSNRTPLAKLSDIPDGTVLRTVFRDAPLLLLNQSGTVLALSGLCTHESCELGWNDAQRLIQCPCHGSAFDPRGQVLKGPATDALPVLRTELRRGWVFVVG